MPPPPPSTPATRPRPGLVDALVLPAWILLGQVVAGIALVPLLFLAEDPLAIEGTFLAVGVVVGWIVVGAGTALWLRLRHAWRREWLVGHAPRPWWQVAGVGVGGAVIGFVGLQIVVSLLSQVSGLEPPQQEIFDLLDDMTVALVVAATAVLAAPVIEEIVFRGVMLDVMARRWSWSVAALAQAAVFSAIHIETLTSPTLFLALGLLGYGFAWLRRLTGSLVAPIVAHLVFNATSMGLALLA